MVELWMSMTCTKSKKGAQQELQSMPGSRSWQKQREQQGCRHKLECTRQHGHTGGQGWRERKEGCIWDKG